MATLALAPSATPAFMPAAPLTMASVMAAWRRWRDGPSGDWTLWQAACAGDPDAARAVIDRLTPMALALARRVVNHPEDAQDMVQEAFLRLWRAQPSDTRGAQLSTYFHTLVLNRCRTHLVRQREWATDPSDMVDLVDAQDWVAADVLPDYPAQQIDDALRRLPARQRLALTLWAHAEAQPADIARELGIEVNAAHQLLHRARGRLRYLLEANHGEA